MSVLNFMKAAFSFQMVLSLFCWTANCQAPFSCEGQVFMVLNGSDELVELQINANQSVDNNTINDFPGVQIDALGFRSTDNFLYGLDPANHNLYKLDADGTLEDLGNPGLQGGLYYFAGDVTPDGHFLVAIGSAGGGGDLVLVKIDLEDPNYAAESFNFNSGTDISDIAFDPVTGNLYGYDTNDRSMVLINLTSGSVTSFQVTKPENEIMGIYFDAFGNMFAIGTTIFGVVAGLFTVDKSTGEETMRTTGPVINVADVASCPWGVEINIVADPEVTFPCSEITYTYNIANRSGETWTGIELEHELPQGFTILGISQNPFGGIVDTSTPPSIFRMKDMSITPGVKSFPIQVEVGDIAGDNYPSQAILKNLPESLGNTSLSDNPGSIFFNDPTSVKVNRIEEDSLFYNQLLCIGETMLLDVGNLGNNLLWNNGTTEPQLIVSEGGVYTLDAVSGCQTVFVSYDITYASCPFTIEMFHSLIPDSIFACNTLIYRFYIQNDTGIKREGFGFVDTLPEGFLFLDVVRNPFGGTVKTSFPSNGIYIKGMTMNPGIDSIDLLVEVGDVDPGVYKNRAEIIDLPLLLGPVRLSDDPQTFAFDSTALQVLGVGADSLYLEKVVCRENSILLDGRQYGNSYLWGDGSTEAQLVVVEPGEYTLTILDGCEPSYVFYTVTEGARVEVSIPQATIEIHQGESSVLSPLVLNQGGTPDFEWADPLGNSLSCLSCPSPVAMPLSSTIYSVIVSNEECVDSASVVLVVEESRRVYAPNVFSPNGDGINDYFYLQSPDNGEILSLTITDRWGSQLFHSASSFLNDAQSGWDGQSRGQNSDSGVFLWRAEMEFIDGKRELFFGEVAVLK